MKIGLVVPGFSADERDWCIPAHLDLARSLAHSHQVHVFALRYPHRHDVYRVRGATVHSLNGQASQGLTSAQLWARTLGAIRLEHSNSPFDILHSIYGGEAGFVTVLASRWLRVPGVVSFLGGELAGLKDIRYGQDLQWRQRLMNRFALGFADRILCGSRRMTEVARARAGRRGAGRIQTLGLGVDTAMFSPGDLVPDGKRNGARDHHIMNVGSLIPVKDHVTLLRATAQLAREMPNLHLTVIGRGNLDPQLRAFASELGISGRVRWVGAIPHDQLPEWYRRADLFVQSSIHEGEGIAVLEAAASGLPVVGTDVGVLSDLAIRGAAVAVPARDPTGLAGAICEALIHPDMLGTRAQRVVLSEYNLERIRERLIQVYRSTADSQDARYLTEPLSRP